MRYLLVAWFLLFAVSLSAGTVLSERIASRVAMIDKLQPLYVQDYQKEKIIKEETIRAITVKSGTLNYVPVVVSAAKYEPMEIKDIQMKEMQITLAIKDIQITPLKTMNFAPSFIWKDEPQSGSASLIDGQVKVVPVYEKRQVFDGFKWGE